MNSLVSYYSEFGNTAKIAHAIGEALEETGPARVVDLMRLTPADLRAIDILIVGVPTHRMNLPETVRVALRKFPRRIVSRKTSIAAFDTSYKMSRWLARFTAARKLLRRLKRLGGRKIVPPETFHVAGRDGPLYEGETERARLWAKSIVKNKQGSM